MLGELQLVKCCATVWVCVGSFDVGVGVMVWVWAALVCVGGDGLGMGVCVGVGMGVCSLGVCVWAWLYGRVCGRGGLGRACGDDDKHHCRYNTAQTSWEIPPTDHSSFQSPLS